MLRLNIKEFKNKALNTYLSGLSNEKLTIPFVKQTKNTKRHLVQSSPLKMINEQGARTDDQRPMVFLST